MSIDHLHRDNGVTERAQHGGIEFLSRFSDCEKDDNYGTEIGEHRHPAADIQKIGVIARIH
jgi:hypothetical protein